MDVAALNIVVDSRDAKSAEGDLRRLSERGRSTEKAISGVGKTSKTAGAGVASLGSKARAAAVGLAAAAASAAALSRVASAAQSYTQMTNSLRAMGLEAGQAVSTLGRIAEVANRTRTPLEATAQLYQRISIAGRDLGASQSDVLKFTENVGLALAQTGTSASEASGALLQLSQAMAGGTVRAEEFNSILEGAFPIAQAAANAIDEAGGSVGRLRQMVVDGEVSSREFFEAILSQSDALSVSFANTETTISQALTVLNNNLTTFAGGVNSALGASQAFANGILAIGENIGRIATYAATAAVALGSKYAAAAAIAAARTITFSGALVTLRAALIRTGIGLLVVGAGELVYQFGRLVGATGGFGSALSALKAVALEVWDRIGLGADFVYQSILSMAQKAKAAFISAIRQMAGAWVDFTWAVSDGLNSLFGTDLAGASALVTQQLGLLENQARAAGDAASSAAAEAAAGFSAPLASVEALRKSTEGFSDEVSGAAVSVSELDDALGDGSGGAAGAAKKASKELTAAQEAAKQLAEEYEGNLTSSVRSVADAFGDWLAGGLQDFESFKDAIISSFKDMISSMIATAVNNRILIGLGLAASPTAAVAGQGAGIAQSLGGNGLLGGLTSGLGGLVGSWGGTGILGGASGLITNTLANGFSGFTGYISSAMSGATASLAGFGTALGAIALPLAGVGLAIAAFRKKTTVLGEEMKLTIRGLDVELEKLTKIEESRFFGLSKSTKTKSKDIDNPVFFDAVAAMRDGVLDMASALDIGTEAIAGFKYKAKFDLEGMDSDQIAERLEAELGLYGDALSEAVLDWGLAAENIALSWKDLAGEGESATDVLSNLNTSLSGVNAMFEYMGDQMYSVSLAGAIAADHLVDLFGSLDAFTGSVTTYMGLFYSEEERLAMLTGDLVRTLADLNLRLPTSREAFRALVEAQDLATEAGRETYAALIQLSSAFNQAFEGANRLSTAVSGAFSGVSGVVTGMLAAANTNLRAADAMGGVIDGLTDLYSEASSYAAAEQGYSATLLKALAGDLDAIGDLPSAARDMLNKAASRVSSSAEYEHLVKRTQADLGRVGGSDHASLYEQQIAVLEQMAAFSDYANSLSADQIAALGGMDAVLNGIDAGMAGYQAGLDAIETALANPLTVDFATLESTLETALQPASLFGTFGDQLAALTMTPMEALRKSVDSLREMIAAEIKALAQANDLDLDELLPKMAKAAPDYASQIDALNAQGQSLSYGDIGALQAKYDELRKRDQSTADNRGDVKYLLDTRIARRALSDAKLAESTAEKLRQQIRDLGGVPSFATGTGYHSGGLAMVHGPELLNLPRGSNVTSVSDTKNLFGALTAEIAALRREVSELRSEQRQLGIKQTVASEDTAKRLRKWDKTGMPAEAAP